MLLHDTLGGGRRNPRFPGGSGSVQCGGGHGDRDGYSVAGPGPPHWQNRTIRPLVRDRTIARLHARTLARTLQQSSAHSLTRSLTRLHARTHARKHSHAHQHARTLERVIRRERSLARSHTSTLARVQFDEGLASGVVSRMIIGYLHSFVQMKAESKCFLTVYGL